MLRSLIGQEGSRVRPPLRWAGSKRSILRVLARHAPSQFERYVEPFAGSAALFFFLDPACALLGDINNELIDFYRVLAARPHAVAKRVAGFDSTGADYYWLRCVTPDSLSRTSAAARFLYLNRFCFNGVYRTNRSGVFNVPRGTKTGALPSRRDLCRAAAALRKASVRVSDFADTLDAATTGDFVYVDPPYFTRNGIKPGEYGHRSLAGQDDLSRLVNSLNRLSEKGVKYMLSYSRSRRLLELLDAEWVRHIAVRRSVGGVKTARKRSVEMLVTNYVPDAAKL